MRFLILLVLCCGLLVPLHAQGTFPYDGVADERTGQHAFTNATIYQTHNQVLEQATLLIKDGKVEAVGTANLAIPEGTIVHDASGLTIYPAFIDLYVEYGVPAAKAVGEAPEKLPQLLSNKPGAYAWNEALKPEFSAHEHFTPSEKTAKELRSQGFGTVLSHQMDGISRGSGTLVALGNSRSHEQILVERASHHLAFSKGKSTQNYPGSLMGSIALLRQTYLDADWYKKQGHQEEVNLSLEAWNTLQTLPQVFEVENMLEALRAAKIAEEFKLRYIIKGDGDEYQRLEEIKATNSAFIVPLNFPEAYDVEDPYDAILVDLAKMKHWELAPANAGRLAEAGVDFCLTTHDLEKPKAFLTHLRRAVEYGLSKEDALKALTYTPAHLLNQYQQVGSLERGKVASFFIANGDILEKETQVLESWVLGEQLVIQEAGPAQPAGQYRLSVGRRNFDLHVKEIKGKWDLQIVVNDTTMTKVKAKIDGDRITLSFTPQGEEGVLRLSGSMAEKSWTGRGQLANGTWTNWSATYQGELEAEKTEKKEDPAVDLSQLGPVIYPFSGYGRETLPQPKTYLIENATVWTNEAEGILLEADVLVQNGKIAAVGQDLGAKGATVIDGTGMHLTPGIIDEHSHIAVSRGVNEGTQASSAEVRIGDVINSEDINIYRQLAGGVTTSQLLHGSANPIGGQSALIKLRWGYAPEKMKFSGAAPFIKFALGENVKQSNWGDKYTTRFPQTRMGVEQIFENYFTEAEKYAAKKKSGEPYRVDLELEALQEIIESKRFITCHSYRQSEINMLMKVAERHGFRVNTFTHILEGYKVADIMAEHGAGGSSFSDWWAYKFEVYEAIPYNGALMHNEGVVVAFNSDDAEMARRLNQEAAKAVLYGGVSEEEALKFVTLNPAKLLHIDDRVGSIKVGKDADLVLWTDHPLSIYAQADKTMIDGTIFYDRSEDLKMREQIREERARLVQKMLEVKSKGGATQKAKGRQEMHYHCDDIADEMGTLNTEHHEAHH